MSPVLFLLSAAHELLDSGKDEISELETRKAWSQDILLLIYSNKQNINFVEKTPAEGGRKLRCLSP